MLFVRNCTFPKDFLPARLFPKLSKFPLSLLLSPSLAVFDTFKE